MRAALYAMLLPFAASLGAFQALAPKGGTIEDTIRFAGLASILGSLTVAVYRLGVWRQEMENTKHSIGAEMKANREETTAHFARLDQRLESNERRLEQLEE